MFKPGIYFGLPDTDYHADPSLSTSGIKKLLQDPEEYWDTAAWNRDAAPRESKAALERGTLWHCRMLEPDKFHERYALAPNLMGGFGENHEVLYTVEDIKAWLDRNRVQYRKSGRKSDLEQAVKDAVRLGYYDGAAPYLYDYENQLFTAENPGKVIIWSNNIYDAMIEAEGAIQEHPYFSKIFKGGMAEVSIFWVDPETNIPMKARIDYLKPNAILDYKTLYVARNKSARLAALNAIKYEHYDIQTAVYTLAAAHAVNMMNDGTGVIWGDVPGDFVDQFKKNSEKPFGFVFQKEDRPYTVRGLKVVRRGGDTFNVFGAGLFYMQQGIQLYQKYFDLYGHNQKWFDPEGMIEVADHEIYYS